MHFCPHTNGEPRGMWTSSALHVDNHKLFWGVWCGGTSLKAAHQGSLSVCISMTFWTSFFSQWMFLCAPEMKKGKKKKISDWQLIIGCDVHAWKQSYLARRHIKTFFWQLSSSIRKNIGLLDFCFVKMKALSRCPRLQRHQFQMYIYPFLMPKRSQWRT